MSRAPALRNRLVIRSVFFVPSGRGRVLCCAVSNYAAIGLAAWRGSNPPDKLPLPYLADSTSAVFPAIFPSGRGAHALGHN